MLNIATQILRNAPKKIKHQTEILWKHRRDHSKNITTSGSQEVFLGGSGRSARASLFTNTETVDNLESPSVNMSEDDMSAIKKQFTST